MIKMGSDGSDDADEKTRTLDDEPNETAEGTVKLRGVDPVADDQGKYDEGPQEAGHPKASLIALQCRCSVTTLVVRRRHGRAKWQNGKNPVPRARGFERVRGKSRGLD